MSKLFGTDGVRGEANSQLTPELAFSLGRAAAWNLAREQGGEIIIGRDTRLSGTMLEAALASGIASVGVDVRLAGVVTTPALAWLTKTSNAVAGAMISASHNPMADNGIKFVNTWGLKLEDAQEEEIESIIREGMDALPRPVGPNVGRIAHDQSLAEGYIEYLGSTICKPLNGLKVVLDCANGAGSFIAPRVLESAGATVQVIYANPDGSNINAGCGSTHPEAVAKAVRAQRADLGLALDGDADRLIAVDHTGSEVDGDKIMLICARHLKEQGLLKDNTLVVTVMSNMGLQLAARDLGIKTVATKVGDRYVLEAMLKGEYSLGGEQSGHVIFRRYATTGDGILTGLQLMEIMSQTGSSLADLSKVMERLPQVLVNVRVASKDGWESNQRINEAIAGAEVQLGDRGRVLVRPSGTEPLIRVMLEGPEQEQLAVLAQGIADVIKAEQG
ncbi:MAG: phosphoglucosamine mutase [Firmicutes bacterium]|nr:phosphoglucosamine mutase [Bacillota bacterium]